MEKLKIGDSIWVINENKALELFVWEIHSEEVLNVQLFDYGATVKREIKYNTYYIACRSKTERGVGYEVSHDEFIKRTKEELIASL